MTQVIHKCKCEKPTQWEDAKGNKTNVCRVCGGKVEENLIPDIGKVHTALDRVLLGDLNLESDHPFIGYLALTIDSKVKHVFQTWNHNMQVQARKSGRS